MPHIDIIGLGAGDMDQLPLGIYRKLRNAKETIYTRTLDHPVIVKLALLEDLPASYGITVIEAAGSNLEKKRTVPLEELDRVMEISNLTSVYIPPVPAELLHHTFQQLREVIHTLRSPGGCPWDRAQTHESLKEYAVEEVYELIDAIDEADDVAIVEELGDVLLQVMLHSEIGEDEGYFTIDEVIKGITDKMVHRHPHVFTPGAGTTKNWDSLKREEKGKNKRKSLLSGIAKSLPALSKAYLLQKQAAKVGFDWDNPADIWNKLDEEMREVKEAIAANAPDEMTKEFGDVLFVLANLTRYYKINPAFALETSNRKFIRRFQFIEKKAALQGKDLQEMDLKEMDQYWDEAKQRE